MKRLTASFSGCAITVLLSLGHSAPAQAAELKCLAGLTEAAAMTAIKDASLTYYNAEPGQLDAAQISFLLGLSNTFQPCLISVGQAQLNGIAGVLLKGQSNNGDLYEAFCSDQSLENCRIRTTKAATTPSATATQWIAGLIQKTRLGTDGYLYKIVASSKPSPELTFYGPTFALP